ncbi:MAG: PilZ domain-containing protein [Proteobacteria bacterium]|nr:PilZ domain-containing protein [Pseudomonadota bacterium]
MTENKRKHSRFNSLNLLHIEVYENDLLVKQGTGRTINVSESGILLETHFLINNESTVLVSIALKESLVEIKGIVIHTIQDSKDKYKIGIKFNPITKPNLEILKVYIDNFTTEKNEKEI